MRTRVIRLALLAAGVAVLAIGAFSGSAGTGAAGPGKWNSMAQSKLVEPCTVETTLEKTADVSTAVVGQTITYTINETNNAGGSCLIGNTLNFTGTFTLENRSSAGSDNTGSQCGVTADIRDTCVNGVLDWVEYHMAGQGSTWHTLTTTAGGATTTSGNNLVPPTTFYCPSDSSGALPAPYAPGACSDTAQPKYGALSMNGGALTTPFALPCGTLPGNSCTGATQIITYTLGPTADLTIPCGPAPALALCDGFRNVVHFDMWNEQISTSGRNHFARDSFAAAELDSNAYNVTVTDDPPGAAIVPADDSCGAPFAVFTACSQVVENWVTDAVTLAGGQTATVTVKYKVRAEDCGTTVTNTATATHTLTPDPAGPQTGEGPAAVVTEITTSCEEKWNPHSKGFWKGPNGKTLYDALSPFGTLDGGGVSIGGTTRGKAVLLNTEAQTILEGGQNVAAEKASCLLVVGINTCAPLDAGVTRNALTKLMDATLALELNIKYLNGGGGLGVTLNNIVEPNCTNGTINAALVALNGAAAGVPPLTGSTPATVTVGQVRATANGLIDHSGDAAVATTDALMNAMHGVLGDCVNSNHAVVPGDRDWDGVPEDIDVCPGDYDPDQSDVDGDGIGDFCDAEMDNDSRGVADFSNAAEDYIGTDWRRDCGLDAWPPDFNGDGTVDVFDVGAVKATFGTQAGEAEYDNREDLTASGAINIADLVVMKRFFNQTCAGVDPIQSGTP